MEAFDQLVARVDAPMIVVTTASGDSRAGCLVGFHCQSSIEPRKYAVWLSKANHTYRVALLAEHLAVHFLAEADVDLAELFGGTTGDEIDKFARCDSVAGPGGVPLLARCPNRLVLRLSATLDERGDHVCMAGEVVQATAAHDFRPLRLSAVQHLEPGHAAEERQTADP